MDNDQVVAVNDEAAPAETAEAPKKATRTRRKAAPKVAADVEAPAAEAPASEAAPEAAAAPVRRTRSRKKAEPAETLPGLDDEATAVGEDAAAARQLPKPSPKRPLSRPPKSRSAVVVLPSPKLKP